MAASDALAHSIRVDAGELLRVESHTAEDTIVVGFNTGMGNASAGMAKGGFQLMQSWLPDLVDLLRLLDADQGHGPGGVVGQ